jgi:hypothetical protein
VEAGALAVLMTQQGQIAADMAGIRADVAKALTRIEVIDSDRMTASALHTDHEARLRGLERWRYALPTATILGIGSAIVTIVENWPHH